MHPFWRDHPWRLRLSALVMAAGLVGLLQALAPTVLSSAESVVGDFTWRAIAGGSPERRIVVVDIDEASLRAVGPWPWPRSTMTRLSQRLEATGAAVQAFDVLFDAPREGDAELRELWAGLPVVAGQIFSLDPAAAPRVGEIAGELAAPGCPAFAPRSEGYIANSPSVLSPGLAVGHLTPRVEFDGVVRKVPALVCHQGRAYPSLALAALWRAAHPTRTVQSAGDWIWAPTSPRGWLAPHGWLTSASLPGVRVPVDAAGDVRVPYRVARGALSSVPAYKVLEGSVDTQVLRGTIALVGATAFGIGDVTATPLSTVASGVEVHVQSMAAMLDHRVPYQPRHAGWLQLGAVLAMSALLWAVAVRRPGSPVKRLPLVGAAAALASYALSGVALAQADLWLPWMAPAVFALVASTAFATAEHALTRAQRERLSAHLGSYLPAPVAERLAASDPSGSLQVDQREVSVLVADIRNFSAFAAHRPPQETAVLLHAFYCIAVDVIEQHGGVVENVVGDSVLAVWNAYTDCDEHPQQAVRASKELLRATRALLSRPIESQQEHLVQPLALGIGTESGMSIVGSFGPVRRRAHAALGEPVSVASRLQKMTQDLSMPILIGPQMARRLQAGTTESLGDYLLEGMSRQYTLYAPADWAELVPTEQLWVDTASSRPPGSAVLGRWPDSLASGSSLAYAPNPLRDA